MNLHLLEPAHGSGNSPIHRLPAELKLAAGLGLITVTVLAPPTASAWFGFAAGILFLVVLLSRIPPLFLLRRLLLLAPFVLGVALVNAFHPAHRDHWPWLLARSALCLLTALLVSNTTPFSEVLRVMGRTRTPRLLVTTLALMHRYLFVLAGESGRMRRARAARTFQARRGWQWRTLASVAGQLFIRASERAGRIYAAMCARGGD